MTNFLYDVAVKTTAVSICHQPLGPNVHYAKVSRHSTCSVDEGPAFGRQTRNFPFGFGYVGFESRCVSTPKWHVMYLQYPSIDSKLCWLCFFSGKNHPRKKKTANRLVYRQRLRAFKKTCNKWINVGDQSPTNSKFSARQKPPKTAMSSHSSRPESSSSNGRKPGIHSWPLPQFPLKNRILVDWWTAMKGYPPP